MSTNSKLKTEIESLGWNYFFNTNICYPKNMKEMYFDQNEKFEFTKYSDDFNIINRQITLNKVKFFLQFYLYIFIRKVPKFSI